MARNDRFNRKQQRAPFRGNREAEPASVPRTLERKPPTQYGKPLIILEDAAKDTFEFVGGEWVPYAMTIAECRKECQVRILPQQVNGKTRYEIRLPLPLE